jgi:hypothetical protein
VTLVAVRRLVLGWRAKKRGTMRAVAITVESSALWGGDVQVIRRSRQALKTYVTHAFPLEDAEKAIQLQISGQSGKVLLYPFGEETG